MLSSADIERFALDGYVLKQGAVARDLVDQAVDVVWENLPGFRRDDPSTWAADVSDCRGDFSMNDRFGLVKLRKEVISDPRIAAITTHNPTILHMAEQLLGAANLAPPRKFRGLYPIFPTPANEDVPPNGHIDQTPEKFRMGVGVYLNEVMSGGGALMVWPGSHRSLHFATPTTGCSFEDIASKEFLDAFHGWNRTDPVEVLARPGDVVFFHNRLLHCPSINARPDHVRLASYFNIRSVADEPVRPGRLWDGWDGIRAIGSSQVAETEDRPLPTPGAADWTPNRRGLPDGGAFAGFPDAVARTLRARERARQLIH